MTSNSNALAVYDDGRFDLMQRTARAMVESGFFQDSKQLAQAVVKVMAGAELGISPFASMTGIHIVQGKPTLSSNLIATLVKNDPRYNYRVRISTDVQCVIDWYEEGERIGESEFTIKEAQAAGLTGKSTWKQYPSDMLFARALTRGARRHAPGIFGGAPVYTPEEMGADVNEDGDIVDVTPEPHQAPEISPVAAVEAEVSTNGRAEQETAVDGENDTPDDGARYLEAAVSSATFSNFAANVAKAKVGYDRPEAVVGAVTNKYDKWTGQFPARDEAWKRAAVNWLVERKAAASA